MSIFLDIEVLDFFADEHIKSIPRSEQLAAMRFGCAVTYNTDSCEWLEWQADAISDLYAYLGYIPNTILTGWNVIDFDWQVISANAMHANSALRECKPEFFDLFAFIRQRTGRWYKLEDVAKTNLGRGKLADGQLAAEWLRSGDPDLVRKAFEYCRHDVQLTMDLAAILERGDPLLLPPRITRGEMNEIRIWRDGRIEGEKP